MRKMSRPRTGRPVFTAVPVCEERFRGGPFPGGGDPKTGKRRFESEFSPLEFAHLMKRQKLHAPDASKGFQIGGERGQTVHAERDVRQQNMTDPDLFSGPFAVFERGKFVLVVLTGEFAQSSGSSALRSSSRRSAASIVSRDMSGGREPAVSSAV